ncbi:hypothetical protein ml_177 [Mollivirus sibericum]|uniref:hypothetical protein n=1 Tax=Mollivirus sibericum TaxID=1678078 RepID=UPI0006B2EA52|nr:hypothetical protein ml_177 [Mollivirus sibericum]ALD61979.1 hypothetical protein ml_177 [Mollivirus sibericum]
MSIATTTTTTRPRTHHHSLDPTTARCVRTDGPSTTRVMQDQSAPDIPQGIQVYLSHGDVKYPICGRCHTPVRWHKGKCRCGKLVEERCFEYAMDGTTFVYRTWCRPKVTAVAAAKNKD